ncbi:MAG: hypothetical protein AAFW83_11410 [Pseudomonadota bacterium]
MFRTMTITTKATPKAIRVRKIGHGRLRAAGAGLFVLSILSGCAVTPHQAPTTATLATSPVPSDEAQAVGTQSGALDFGKAPDRAAILATVDRFFEGLALKDADAVEATISPWAIGVSSYPERPGEPVRYYKISESVEAMRAGKLPKIEEPYWNPIVLQRKSLAMVWTPYEVWVDETLSHCGVDVFNLTRQSGAWKINAVHYTTEPSVCEEVWPDGRSQLRPKMFSEGM